MLPMMTSFICLVALARRQPDSQDTYSVLKTSCHLSATLGGGFTVYTFPFAKHQAEKL